MAQPYYDPKFDTEVQLVESIQVTRTDEFSRNRIDHYEPKFMIEGSKFPDNYAIPISLANSVYDETGHHPAEYDINVVDPDDLEKL